MKKVTATLITSSVFFILHAEIPFNSVGQQLLSRNSADGSWDVNKDVVHSKQVLPDESTEFSFYRPVYRGGERETVVYDPQGNLISENNVNNAPYRSQTKSNSYTYSADNRMLTSSKYMRNSFRGGYNYSESNSTYIYGNSGPKIQEITYTRTSHYRAGVHYDTITTSYQYNGDDKLTLKVRESVALNSKTTSNYVYSTTPTGETVITENRSQIDGDGNWSWSPVHPIKTYCLPNDTIVEEYLSSTGELFKRIYSSYTLDGTLLESTEYGLSRSERKLERRSRKFFRYNVTTSNEL